MKMTMKVKNNNTVGLEVTVVVRWIGLCNGSMWLTNRQHKSQKKSRISIYNNVYVKINFIKFVFFFSSKNVTKNEEYTF